MKAMILAAGRGVRMGALTDAQPKPLLQIGGTSLIERHVERLAESGVAEVVINLSYRGAQVRERLGDGSRFGVAIAYSEEGEPPLETGGGILNAMPLLGADPFMLVNSDVCTDFPFAALVGAQESTLVLVPNPTHHPRGDFGIDASGDVTAAPPLLTYGGIAVLSPALFAGVRPGRSQLKPVLDAAIANRALRGRRYDGAWIDVGTPERLEEAHRWVVAREAK